MTYTLTKPMTSELTWGVVLIGVHTPVKMEGYYDVKKKKKHLHDVNGFQTPLHDMILNMSFALKVKNQTKTLVNFINLFNI